jgi:hypothetical protein
MSSTRRQLSRTLNTALAVEVDLHLNQEQGIPQPEFNREELDQLEANAAKLREPKMLYAAQNCLAQHYGDARDGLEKMAARAARVEESAKASLRSAGEPIRSFVENREFFPVLFKGVDGSEKTATLNELAPNTFGETVASFFSISQRLEIAAVQEALDQHHVELLQECDTLQQFAEGAGAIAETYLETVQTSNLVITQPQFTAHAGIESFTAQQTGVGLGTQFQEITGSAMNSNGISNISNAVQHSAQGMIQGWLINNKLQMIIWNRPGKRSIKFRLRLSPPMRQEWARGWLPIPKPKAPKPWRRSYSVDTKLTRKKCAFNCVLHFNNSNLRLEICR